MKLKSQINMIMETENYRACFTDNMLPSKLIKIYSIIIGLLTDLLS